MDVDVHSTALGCDCKRASPEGATVLWNNLSSLRQGFCIFWMKENQMGEGGSGKLHSRQL